jgi:hypothetical protein
MPEEVLKVPAATVARGWTIARAWLHASWLHREINRGSCDGH